MRILSIMAGGGGVRFWPESRRARPKQFLSVTGNRSLLQATADRVQSLIPWEQTSVITGEDYAVATRSQLPLLPDGNLFLEPAARNTAACLGLAAAIWSHRHPDAVMAVVPADHLITPDDRFRRCLELAYQTVERSPERICLMGITPTRPATGYGYIEVTTSACSSPHEPVPIIRFREKPDQATATEFVMGGRHLWNAGIFVWRASRLLELLDLYAPAISEVTRRMASNGQIDNWSSEDRAAFHALPSISIDHAVLEPRSLESDSGLFVIPGDFSWSDVGSWSTWPELWGRDENGNTVRGASVHAETSNCIIQTSREHLVATYGVEGLLIVHTPTATLVARRDDEAGLRRLVAELDRLGHSKWL